MRAFLVLVLFFIAFLIFANGSLAGVNLTSNTPGAAQAAGQPAAQSSAPQVITIQESTAASQSNGVIPVTGSCTNPYTVQPGDSLSQIAANCNTTLAALRQANPQITDANMIFPGQQLSIPNASSAPSAQAQESPAPFVPQTLPTQAPTATPVQSVTTPVVPVTGPNPIIAAGTGMQVKGIGYPANTPVNIAIGPQAQGYTVVASGVTDASGNITTQVSVPTAQNSQTPYVVVVATTSTPPIQAMSRPFFVGPANP